MSQPEVACYGSLLTYLCFLLLLLQLLSVAVLLDSFAEVAVLQVLDFGLHHIQQLLQLCDPLRLLSRSAHVLMSLLSRDTHTHTEGSISKCTECKPHCKTHNISTTKTQKRLGVIKMTNMTTHFRTYLIKKKSFQR